MKKSNIKSEKMFKSKKKSDKNSNETGKKWKKVSTRKI